MYLLCCGELSLFCDGNNNYVFYVLFIFRETHHKKLPINLIKILNLNNVSELLLRKAH